MKGAKKKIVCPKCGSTERTKADKRKPSGRCAACARASAAAYRKRKPEKARARSAAWVKRNPEKARAIIAAWRQRQIAKTLAADPDFRVIPDALAVAERDLEELEKRK